MHVRSFLWAALCCCEAVVAQAPLATTVNGTYEGAHLSSWDQDAFLGIPFAQPPIGDLRWRWPQSLNESFADVRDASKQGYSCMQFRGNFDMSEDCLTLNVVRPSGKHEKPLPVLVWIFGGGLFTGSIADPQYNLSGIVKALPAPFTSWGPTWETELKPQFAAPGGHILSLWPRALGSYAVLGGTSMATPLVSGVLALLAEIRGRLDPVELTNILAATAKPHFFNDGNQAFNQLAPVPQQGAGLIQSYEAAFTTTIFSVSSLAFNDTEHLRSLSFSIKNVGDADVTYTLDHRPAAMAYTFAAGTGRANTFPNELTDDYATLYFSKPIITVKAEREEKVTVSLDLPEDVDNAGLPVYSGYIALYGDDGKVLHLPYMGIAGSMRETPVLASANGFVYEAQTPTRSIVNASFVLPAQGTADPTTDTLPGVNLEFILGTSVAYLEVIPVGSHDEGLTYEFLDVRTMGSAVPALRWITRQTDVVLTWDGQLDSEKYAPAGRYKFHVKVLRVFGDAEDPDDYDTIETAAFSIRYEASSG
ncbi:hypothetical protein BN1708_016674 [Verticillium longisporum]|uniref:Peptidase S8/S53 domain-containing protein n=1 Tax=Verticillium longisporum TaxID=100787 RepID=A0A0G4MXC6_VERLO|nr:hypothetical protein BN1708_016674 [Verticillium longisporum]